MLTRHQVEDLPPVQTTEWKGDKSHYMPLDDFSYPSLPRNQSTYNSQLVPREWSTYHWAFSIFRAIRSASEKNNPSRMTVNTRSILDPRVGVFSIATRCAVKARSYKSTSLF